MMKFFIKKDHLKNIVHIMMILAVTVAITMIKKEIVANMKRKEEKNVEKSLLLLVLLPLLLLRNNIKLTK